MDRPNFAAMDTALYQASEEMILEIIIQKDRTIVGLRGRIDAMERQKNQKIQELEQRLLNLEREKNIRIEELEQQNYALKQQIIGLEHRINQRGQEEIERISNKGMMGEKIMTKEEEARQKSLQNKILDIWCQRNGKWKMFSSWSGLEGQTQLNLYQGNLEELPIKLCSLTQLKKLDFSNNKLSSVPENIGALKELQTLYLDSNQLTKLPQSLGNLSKLQTLSIRSNPHLKELPESFKNLKELNLLAIDWQLLPQQNIFKTEPFASLKNLRLLYIFNKERKEKIQKEGEQSKIYVQFY